MELSSKRGASGQSVREGSPIIKVGEVAGMEGDSTRQILSKTAGEVLSLEARGRQVKGGESSESGSW